MTKSNKLKIGNYAYPFDDIKCLTKKNLKT